MQDIRAFVTQLLKKEGISAPVSSVEYGEDLTKGDLASNVALKYAKELRVTPRELAEKIVADLGVVDGISKIEVAGPGFINFTLSNDAVYGELTHAYDGENDWGKNNVLSGKKIIVEYTDPNPFKEFHIGHLVTNAIGESIARLHEFAGAEVRRANYQGDVGRHVARAIWGLLQSKESPEDVKALGRAYASGAKADIDESPAKQEITEINKKVYARTDPAINDLYDRGRKTSLDHFEELYAVLGTTFDFYFFESVAGPFGKTLVQSHIQDGVFKESDGAVVYEGEKKGLHTRVFLNSEGLPTYEAKELGLAKLKYHEFPYDHALIVTGNEIAEYFKVLRAAMGEVYPDLAEKTEHVPHGMMRLEEGKMSSRTGNVVTGESLINDLADVARAHAEESRAEDKEKLAQEVAVAAIKFQILKGGTSKDIIFNRERALSLEGDSGPYLQYAHARAVALSEKAREKGIQAAFDVSEKPSDLARLLIRFPAVVDRACSEREPHYVANYLVLIASTFNSWYAQEQILGKGNEAHKIALTDATRITLKNGLWLLGIPAPEKV